MPAYLIATIKITDPDRYREYERLAGPPVRAFGGKLLFRSDSAIGLEGNLTPTRVIVFEFEDLATAQRFYESPAYQEAIVVRQEASEGQLSLVELPVRLTAGQSPPSGAARSSP
jgi:uncharacterized protein (DUF1330 family)